MSEQIIPPEETTQITLVNLKSEVTTQELEIARREPVQFQTHFRGTMEMYGQVELVAEYLNDHQGWFTRCAAPMKAEPFGDNGYTLIIGNYGAFGYEVEPQMSVILESSHDGAYLMYSVPNSDFNHSGYQVDYQSTMEIEEITIAEAASEIDRVYRRHGIERLPETITQINWHLTMEVQVEFPSFIYRLPMPLIQKTGDRLLAQIVHQVSPRLSFKVQKDFHARFHLPLPPKTARTCHNIKKNN